ncbi:MAG: hypothetical protein AAGI88_06190 [Pseudomonadota bacterium]
MLPKALVAFFLSIPAAAAILGLFLVWTPDVPAKVLPSLLMFFPLWICVGAATYFIPRTKVAVALMVAVACVGFALIEATKYFGIAGI